MKKGSAILFIYLLFFSYAKSQKPANSITFPAVINGKRYSGFKVGDKPQPLPPLMFSDAFLMKMDSAKSDTILNADIFIKYKLLQHQILPTPDAIALIKFLNPEIRANQSYPLTKNLIFPDYPAVKPKVLRQNERKIKLANKPSKELNAEFTKLINELQNTLPTLSVRQKLKDSINEFVQDIIVLSKYSQNANRLYMKYVTGLLFDLAEFCKQYNLTVTDKIAGDNQISGYLKSLYVLIPIRKKLETGMLDYDNPQQHLASSSPRLFNLSNNIESSLSEFNLNPLIEFDHLVTFNVYVYDSKRERDPKRIFTAPEMQGAYYILYQIPMNTKAEVCGRRASIAFLTVPLAEYYIDVANSKGDPIKSQRIDLEQYLSEQNWAKYDKMALVIDINQDYIQKNKKP